MKVQKMNRSIQIGVVLSFLLMVTVGFLGDLLPINGQTTAAVAAKYSTLFNPAGFTFSIWGVIYILLVFYILYQIGFFHKNDNIKPEILNKTGLAFILSSLANSAWIFAWHFEAIALSLLLIVFLLLCLIYIVGLLNKVTLLPKNSLFLRIPFDLYFGWITVAAIANFVTLLVYWGWSGWGLSVSFWTVLVLMVGIGIGFVVMLHFQSIWYGLVLIWSYFGILMRHSVELQREYPSVITSTGIGMAIFAIGIVVLLHERWEKNLSMD